MNIEREIKKKTQYCALREHSFCFYFYRLILFFSLYSSFPPLTNLIGVLIKNKLFFIIYDIFLCFIHERRSNM